MTKYVTLKHTIDAWQFDGRDDFVRDMNERFESENGHVLFFINRTRAGTRCLISGVATAQVGDWIIRDIAGRLSVMEDGMFQGIYTEDTND